MIDIYRNKREGFYDLLINEKGITHSDLKFIIIMHVAPDLIAFIRSIEKMGNIALVVAIPYSIDQDTLSLLKEDGYNIITPSLDKLLDTVYLNSLMQNTITNDAKYIVVEVGGYISTVINSLDSDKRQNIIGIVEDTEAGHRNYEKIQSNLPCPVISVARSHLKEAEDMLIGMTCIHALENIFRSIGLLFHGQPVLIVGFGKIGHGVAKVVKRHYSSNVMIYDCSPQKRILALCEGYQIPDIDVALGKAEIILGATGNLAINKKGIQNIRPGAMLVSCSSKQNEIDVDYIKSNYTKTHIAKNIDKYQNDDTFFYLLGDGYPINFAEKKFLSSPIISLIHGEMLLSVINLIQNKNTNKITELPYLEKEKLSIMWLNHFCHSETGRYQYV